jgi:hypothetical protein
MSSLPPFSGAVLKALLSSAKSRTVRGAFRDFLSRIELNPTRVQLASERYTAVKGVVERALPGKQVRQVGSFQRQTKIRPADLGDELDIDALPCHASPK